MRLSILFTAAISILLFTTCKKEDKQQGSTKRSMTFKMDGTEYTFDITQFVGGSDSAGNFRIVSAENTFTGQDQPTDFPYWFDIRQSSTGAICAVLMPKEFPIPYIDSLGRCNFQIPVVDQNGNSLSADKVFYYQSGKIDYSRLDCGNRSYFEDYCLCTITDYRCDLSGTLSLKFTNGLNESVSLVEGKFFMPDAGY